MNYYAKLFQQLLNVGAAMSLVLMILIFICVAVMNRFGEGDGEEVIKV